MEKLTGKTAVITGSTRGFGLAMAQAFTQAGAAVVLCSRTAESVAQEVEALTKAGAQVSGIPCDVNDLSQVEKLKDHALESFGRLDIWVNNAAISAPYGPTVHIDPEVFREVLQVNILGTYYGSLVAMRHFLDQGYGKLINVLGAGDKRPVPFQTAYASSKAWMIQFTRALAQEHKVSGVGVYGLNPGMMDTDLLQKVQVVDGFEHQLDRFETVIEVLSQSPEIPARKAVWLASQETDGRTGLVVRELTRAKIFRNVGRKILNLLVGRTDRQAEVQITTVPSDFLGKGKGKR